MRYRRTAKSGGAVQRRAWQPADSIRRIVLIDPDSEARYNPDWLVSESLLLLSDRSPRWRLPDIRRQSAILENNIVKTVSTSPTHCLVVRSLLPQDPVAAGLLSDAQALNLKLVRRIDRQDLYFLEGRLSESEKELLRARLLTDPVTQTGAWRAAPLKIPKGAQVVEVALRPGVTDPVAEEIVRCAHMLGVKSVERAATGQRFLVYGRLKPAELRTLARRLLANNVIQRFTLGEIEPVFPHPAEASGAVEVIPVRELGDKALAAVSQARRAALDLEEMRAIRDYFRAEGRDPTDVEFEMIAQTWSEHCGHKTFKARIEVQESGEVIDGLLRTYIRYATEKIRAPWVRSAFVDNAGIIDFDRTHEVSFKVETHNHPSAIEPFGGANTGVGGVIRDVLGVSAKPIAATDVLCFGPQDADPRKLPEGVLHPRRIRSGVVAGVQDYGNKIGIPTVNGALWYDPAFTSNPLVYCGCVGVAPKGKHLHKPQAGDHVIVLGGRTGRDGLRGATFSSMTMDAQTGEVSGASVQIGDPITEKGLIEVIVRARDAGLYHAVTDCGAGGLSSAVGEMASRIGADVELRAVELKYPGLAPWEIWLSEAQERMVLAVPPGKIATLQKICAVYDVALTDIGRFTGERRTVVRYDARVVLDLANKFLHDCQPVRRMKAVLPKPQIMIIRRTRQYPAFDPNDMLLRLLTHPNIASKADVIRVYDHEVQGGTAVKPLTGAVNDGPSDACVLKPIGTGGTRGIVLSNGFNPELGKADPYRMAVSVIDEAIRNAVAVGADPARIGLLDNFCAGDPLRPETLGGLVETCRGCRDAALHYRAPFISGKDSLNNEYIGSDGRKHAIPPSLLISAIGILEDVSRAVTMDLKQAGNAVYLLGDTKDELGGSHFQLLSGVTMPTMAPGLPSYTPALYRALHKAMRKGLVQSCHDLSEGGLAVAAAEMSLAGRLGLALTLEEEEPAVALFSESNGRFLVEVRPQDRAAFEAEFSGSLAHHLRAVGETTTSHWLNIGTAKRKWISLPVELLVEAWIGNDL
jgi:phosphoribosylformylglycinamidine synthase